MNTVSLDVFDPQTAALEDALPRTHEVPLALSLTHASAAPPHRPAWLEIDLYQLRANLEIINRDKPRDLQILSIVKDEAYGHGAYQVARTSLQAGAKFLGLSTLYEAIALRERGIEARILLLGDHPEAEFPWCIAYQLTCCVSAIHSIDTLDRLACDAGERVPVHIKVNTGMNRYGVRWPDALALAERIATSKSLYLEGVLSHFAQSDETDKTFAQQQLLRFNEVLHALSEHEIHVPYRHICNSGGFLDLPMAHFDMVRLGILPLGVYPSSVCRRIPGIQATMTVKARIAAIQHLEAGDTVGYGMRFTANSPRRIGVLPIGYGDGFPRVRNQGFVLVHGQRVPIIGGVAMDALTIDITDLPSAQLWDEAVLMGRQGDEEISVHEVAKLKGSVSYDVLTGWRSRLPRIYLHQNLEP